VQITNPSATFTRPADVNAYTAGDLIANSVTAGSVVPMRFDMGNSFPQAQFRLTRARLFKSSVTVGALAAFRLHLYQGLPVVTNGDNGAYLTTQAANWIGNVDVAASTMFAFSDGAAGNGAAAAGSEILLRATAAGPVYGLLVALAAYVPTSAETFTVTLEELDAY
jgi:hypothetical protein